MPVSLVNLLSWVTRRALLSPVIHQQFARQFGHNIDYSRQRLEPASFAQYVRDFFAPAVWLNVTVPFKLLAHECADTFATARQAGAANALT